MEKSYSAFGLELRSGFPLAGMTPVRPAGLPVLALSLETPAELEDVWVAAEGAGAWRGMLSDGNELKIERGPGGLLFSYGSRARFRLDPVAGRLGCAPLDPTALDWQRVLLDRVLPQASLAFGREAIHAAAVETPLGVVAIAAAGGTGKSTLAAEMVRRGHRFFCDDVLVLGGGGAVVAHPGAPHMTLDPAGGSVDVAVEGSALGVLDGECWIEVAAAAAPAPRPVAAVALLERAAGLSLEAESLPASPLALAPFMLGLPDDDGRDGRRFALYSDLVEATKLLALRGDAADSPRAFADELERAVGLGARASSGSLR
jgi:hypothetical protein